MKRQHWRFLAYANEFLTAGIAVSKDEKSTKVIDYQRTQRLLKIWMANRKNMRRKSIAEKIAPVLHTSSKRAFCDVVPCIQYIFSKNKAVGMNIAEEFDLSDEEFEWLNK